FAGCFIHRRTNYENKWQKHVARFHDSRVPKSLRYFADLTYLEHRSFVTSIEAVNDEIGKQLLIIMLDEEVNLYARTCICIKLSHLIFENKVHPITDEEIVCQLKIFAKVACNIPELYFQVTHLIALFRMANRIEEEDF